MSEPKRIGLTTIDVHNKEKKQVKSVPKTVRFMLTLTESNEKSCPIFNYRELLESKVEDQKPTNGFADPFGNEDDDSDVHRIARQFEAKYNTPISKRKKKKYKGDYADMGAGYDESDSFIDNTDAYDEIVPEDVSPVHGGFYINSGSLEFKQKEVDTEVSPTSPKSAINRKRVMELEDSDEDSNDKNIRNIEKKPKVELESEKVSKKKDEVKDINVLQPKKKLSSDPFKKKSVTVKELLKEKRDDSDAADEKPKSPKDVPPNTEQKKVGATVNDAIESVISAAKVPHIHDESSNKSSNSVVSTSNSEDSCDSSGESSDEKAPTNSLHSTNNVSPEYVKLPDNLPEEIVQLVELMKSSSSETQGKRKYFSENLNNMLLKLELLIRNLSKSTVSQIYGHIASFVQCKKATIFKRAKKLVIEEEKIKMLEPIRRLNECIEKTMPSIIDSYNKECRRVSEKRLAHESDPPNSEKPKLRMPKRKFVWSDTSRKHLSDIISIRRQSFLLEKHRKEKFDQYLESFYKDELLPLWPEGWMSISHLMRESIPFLSPTERPVKVDKKVLEIPSTKPQITSNGNSKHYELTSMNPKVSLIRTGCEQQNLTRVTISSSPSLSIQPVSTNVNSIKSTLIPISTSSGLTIEPILNKPSIEAKTKVKTVNSSIPADVTIINHTSNLPKSTNLDPTETIKHLMSLEMQNIATPKSHKIPKSRTNSPTPNNMNSEIYVKKHKSEHETKRPKESVGSLSVKKLNDLLPPSVIEINTPPTSSIPSITSTASVIVSVPKMSNDKPEREKELEIIEIKDDDNEPDYKKHKKMESSNLPKLHHKPKKRLEHSNHNPDSTSTNDTKYSSSKSIDMKPHIKSANNKHSLPTGTDLISQIISDTLSNPVTMSAVSKGMSMKNSSYSSHDHSERDNDYTKNYLEPGLAANNDLLQVMKDLRDLEEMTSDKSREQSQRHSNSPVSVIPVSVNHRHHSISRLSSVNPSASTESTPKCDVGFQDIFQKHIFQDQKDCNSTTNNYKTSDKIRLNSNSHETYPFIGSSRNSTTSILPVSTSHKYTQNLTLGNNTSLAHIQSQTAQHTGTSAKKDVMLFPNFLYEYQLNRKTGPAQKSPPY